MPLLGKLDSLRDQMVFGFLTAESLAEGAFGVLAIVGSVPTLFDRGNNNPFSSLESRHGVGGLIVTAS
jgi:hypothetical protein